VLPGDYNADGQVDAADYVVWRKGYGESVPNWSGADGNGDGVVDDDDFAVWTAGYGSPAAGSGSALAPPVPEPAATALACVALVGACLSRRRLAPRVIVAIAERDGGP
jgi:hypothetical protein